MIRNSIQAQAEEVTFVYHFDKQGDYYAFYSKKEDAEEWEFNGFCVSVSEESTPVWDYVEGDGVVESLSPEQKEQITSVTFLSEIDGQPVTALSMHYYSSSHSSGVSTTHATGTGGGLLGLKNLTTVTIPGSVKSIHYAFFTGCDSLTEILTDGSVDFTSVDGVLYSADMKTLVRCPEQKAGAFAVPDATEKIEYSAFKGCTALTSIDLSENLTAVGSDAFQNCSSLESLTLPECMTEIPYGFLRGCTSLKSLTIPGSIETFQSSAVNDCTSLAEILVNGGEHYTSVDGVLYTADKKTLVRVPLGKEGSFTIPDGLEEINSQAFHDCDKLTSVSIPKDAADFDFSLLSSCTGLTEIVVDGNEHYASVDGLVYSPDLKTLLRVPSGIEGTLTIPNGTETIGPKAFTGCTKIPSVQIPASLTTIGERAFSECDGLVSITIPRTVESIGDQAFYFCDSLKNVKIENGVTSLGEGAFFWCQSLTSIVIPGSIETVSDSAFYGSGLKSVKLEQGVKFIMDSCFKNCIALTKITLPDGLLSIGNSAFLGTGEQSIIIPSSVISIDFNNAIGFSYGGTPKYGYVVYGTPGSQAEYYASLRSYFTFSDVANAPKDASLGDVNGDESIDATDAADILIAAANLGAGERSGLTADQETAADVNGDAEIDATDASNILLYAAMAGAGSTLSFEDYLKSQEQEEKMRSYVNAVASLVNAERAKAGVKALSISPALNEAAAKRAAELTQEYSHTRPDGRDCLTVLNDNGIPWLDAGENIADGWTTPEEVMNAWMQSEGHKANILLKDYSYIGIGVAEDNGRLYWVQLFTGGKSLEGAYLPDAQS